MDLHAHCQNEATLFTESQNHLRDQKTLTEQIRRLCLMFSLTQVLVCYDFIAICQTELGYIKFLKIPTDAQGGKNENTVTIVMCWNQSTVTKFT
jgi:hypothetical protein